MARLTLPLAVLCALLACSLPTPAPTPEPTATPTRTPTATPTPEVVVLPPFCILPPAYLETKAIVQREHPDAEVPRDGALLFAVRFRDEDGEYMAMLGYKRGAWELIYVVPWDSEVVPTATPTPTPTPQDGAEEAQFSGGGAPCAACRGRT